MVGETHQNERRIEILRAAQKVFDRHGYAATTVEQVATAAGVAKGSLYNYFKSKHDLFVQVFTEVIAREEQATDRLITEPIPATEKLHRLLDDYFLQLGYYKKIGRLVLEFWVQAAREQQDGQLKQWFDQMYTRWRSRIAEIIHQGIEAGEFRVASDAQVAAALIMAVLDGITVQSILDMSIQVNEQFIAALKRAMIASLKAGLTNPTNS